MAQVQRTWKRDVLNYPDDELRLLMPLAHEREEGGQALRRANIYLDSLKGVPDMVSNGGIVVPRDAVPLYEKEGLRFTVHPYTTRRSSQPLNVQRELHV